MNLSIPEKEYPISFRHEDAQKLGENIKNRRSVVLIGMKRVGISNFLRFFLYNKGASEQYLDKKNYLFIPVDLNDLVEREIYPFWVLTFKRLSDKIEKADLPLKVKKQIELYFLDSIQSQDLFLTIDYLRKSLNLLCDNSYLPTIFFLRFDRMKDAVTHDLFANIRSLIDTTDRRLSYVFTSDRPLDHIDPAIFTKSSLSVFSDNQYLKPSNREDVDTILNSSLKEYEIKLSPQQKENLLQIVDGHTQYLLYALISIKEAKTKTGDLKDFLMNDERVILQSEELWESLTGYEQNILIKAANKNRLTTAEKNQINHLFQTGFLDEKSLKIFSPIFADFVESKRTEKERGNSSEFSKKELTLLRYLESRKNEVCEREEIIESVWPETESLGVTDWAIDRLIARVRNKLKNSDKNYEIVTIKTRGYKLIER